MAHSTSLVSAFDFSNPSLFRGRARLLPGRLELTGWSWRGRYRRQIPADRILHADVRGDELILWLFDGETLRLHIDQPAAWKTALETWITSRPV